MNSTLFYDFKQYYDLAISKSDPRTKDWFLVWNSPVAVITLTVLYILFIIFGKRYMQNRKEINVPIYVLSLYNFFLVILSLYMFIELILGIYQSNYNLLCAKLNISYSEGEMRVSSALWLYFVSKGLEFMDTVFMIIRKKFNQVTFLHCFHHSTMLIIWWCVIMWLPGGQSYFGATINSAVHVIMYLYYALSAIPSMRDKLWWKKYITNFQLIQFFFTFAHTTQALVTNCDYPKWGLWLLFWYMLIMIALFTNFYIHEYISKKNKKKHHNNHNHTHNNHHHHQQKHHADMNNNNNSINNNNKKHN